MKKNIFILLTIFMLFYASCAKAQTLGAGVSVDSQGNLVINVPLYVVYKNDDKNVIKPAPSSMNLPVFAGIFYGQDGSYPLEISGGIVKGRISVTIEKPNEYITEHLIDIMHFWDIPVDLFKSWANVAIGELDFRVNDLEGFGYRSITLYPDSKARVLLGEEKYGYKYKYIEGSHYEFIYSMGDVNFSGKLKTPSRYNWKGYGEYDIHLKQGWNIVSRREYFDEMDQEFVGAGTSSKISSKALWVVIEEIGYEK
jgi:hypothetical protein